MSIGTVKFKSSCIKTLTRVEVDTDASNQHEFNGVKELKALLGIQRFSNSAIFTVRNTPARCVTDITWYDARERHVVRTEHRLYFQTNIVMDQAEVGDNVIIGFDDSDKLHFVLIKRAGMSDETFVGWHKM